MERPGGEAVRRRWGARLVATAAAVAVVFPAPLARAGAAVAAPPGVGAKGAFLLDATADRALWGKEADVRRQMASTAKIMTAVVVLDGHGAALDRRISIKQSYRDYVVRTGASTADLRTGDELTARQLLYGLMLPSGCDAAYALADAFGEGRTEAARTASFVDAMNKKAAELGLRNTRFDSFDGLSSSSRNYSTPRDLARLSRHAMAGHTFTAVMSAMSTHQKAANVSRTYTWYNTNKLLGSYSGVIGIKTGSTSAAGPCLVFAARREKKTVIGVVLNDPTSRYPDAARMLDYAFGKHTPLKLRQLPPAAHED
ncbi:D-alanyl-D-alanine carboxypeptidase family protein [Streptomyces gamaensis]|uniref:D-alanyl-D-alanine carboxypeptidase family protein n=1 Tax=Streptomyces gamaensis TaxID=1763542 RepID=A0ABW0Z308_9ACTN